MVEKTFKSSLLPNRNLIDAREAPAPVLINCMVSKDEL